MTIFGIKRNIYTSCFGLQWQLMMGHDKAQFQSLVNSSYYRNFADIVSHNWSCKWSLEILRLKSKPFSSDRQSIQLIINNRNECFGPKSSVFFNQNCCMQRTTFDSAFDWQNEETIVVACLHMHVSCGDVASRCDFVRKQLCDRVC